MLKLTYDSKEDIPEGAEKFYKEADGKWTLQAEVPSPADLERSQGALKRERDLHKATKEKLAKFGGRDPEALEAELAKIPELEAQVEAAGKGSSEAVDKLVEARVKRIIGPVERERDALKTRVGDLEKSEGDLRGTITRTTIHDGLRSAGVELKVRPQAMSDVLLRDNIFEVAEDGAIVTRDAKGLKAGLTPAQWLKDQQDNSPHWWEDSVGGGAGGNRGGNAGMKDNPWATANWNMTAQGAFVKAHGMEKAKQAAARAGTSVGGDRPKQAAA